MCTYQTIRLDLGGSARDQAGWAKISSATVYFDHPVHEPAVHSLNVDFFVDSAAGTRRIGLELGRDAARRLAQAILDSLDANQGLA
jgi:hypothetical protein